MKLSVFDGCFIEDVLLGIQGLSRLGTHGNIESNGASPCDSVLLKADPTIRFKAKAVSICKSCVSTSTIDEDGM